MAFFQIKKIQTTTDVRLQRLERIIWVLIYGGLLSLVLGLFVEQSQGQDASAMKALGGLAVAIGVVLIYVRSRLNDKK